MKIAAVQMVSSTQVAANLARAEALVAQAAALGAELVVLPEYFCGMGMQDTDKLAWCEAAGEGTIQQTLARWARTHRLWLVGGTVPLRTDDPQRVFNTSLAFSPDGDCVARYDKIHLFRFARGQESYDEARVIQPGRQPVTFDCTARDGRTWRVGMSVCYDLRFPELYRQLAQQGADVLLVPSAFTHTTGQAHWEVLLRARAVENQCVVVAAAQGGRHENGRLTWGHSMVIDAWGQVQALQAQGEGVVLGHIDAAALEAVRIQLPAREHRIL